MPEQAKSIQKKFNRVEILMDSWENKIYEKRGWFFVTHRYSQDALKQCYEAEKIYSITKKIGDDYKHWQEHKKLSTFANDTYLLERSHLEERKDQILIKIQDRKPTWWEEFKGGFVPFFDKIMDNLPVNVGLIKQLIGIAFKGVKLLPFLKK